MDQKIKVLERFVDKPNKTYVAWIYGKTGTGKTEMVKKLVGNRLICGETTKDEIKIMYPIIKGYTLTPLTSDTRILIIDNLYPDDYSLKQLLNIIDGTTIRVKMKGLVTIHPKEIYITSLWKPEDLYPNAEQLFKKITKIVHL